MISMPKEFAITLLILEFLAGFVEPTFFVIFTINLILIIIQVVINKKK